MTNAYIFTVASIKRLARGGGIETTPLVTHHSAPEAKFTTGMSVYPKGKGAPLHRHNCDEQVSRASTTGA